MNAVELTGVALARGGRTVLAGVDAHIAPGEFIAILGPNGSGKTTLLQAILGLIQPARGEIRILGQKATPGAATVGYLPQKRGSISDMPLRGWDFVASAVKGERWGLPRIKAEDRADIAGALALVEATGLAARPMAQLSGGEVQRMLLAKALLGRPKVLLLDEPLMSLDLRFQAGVVALVRRIQKDLGLTVLFTAHELNPLLEAIDRVFYLAEGRAALGPVDEIVTSEMLSRLYRTPIDVIRLPDGRRIVVSAHGEIDIHAHHHDL